MAGNLKCIKCGKSELDFQQDNNGCEYIAENVYKEKFMFLCSECIYNFNMVKELRTIIDNSRTPYIPSVHLKNLSPDWLKTKEGQDFLYRLENYQRKISQ